MEENALSKARPAPCACGESLKERLEELEDRLLSMETMLALVMGKRAAPGPLARLLRNIGLMP